MLWGVTPQKKRGRAVQGFATVQAQKQKCFSLTIPLAKNMLHLF